jgi:hypothetical protein
MTSSPIRYAGNQGVTLEAFGVRAPMDSSRQDMALLNQIGSIGVGAAQAYTKKAEENAVVEGMTALSRDESGKIVAPEFLNEDAIIGGTANAAFNKGLREAYRVSIATDSSVFMEKLKNDAFAPQVDPVTGAIGGPANADPTAWYQQQSQAYIEKTLTGLDPKVRGMVEGVIRRDQALGQNAVAAKQLNNQIEAAVTTTTVAINKTLTDTLSYVRNGDDKSADVGIAALEKMIESGRAVGGKSFPYNEALSKLETLKGNVAVEREWRTLKTEYEKDAGPNTEALRSARVQEIIKGKNLPVEQESALINRVRNAAAVESSVSAEAKQREDAQAVVSADQRWASIAATYSANATPYNETERYVQTKRMIEGRNFPPRERDILLARLRDFAADESRLSAEVLTTVRRESLPLINEAEVSIRRALADGQDVGSMVDDLIGRLDPRVRAETQARFTDVLARSGSGMSPEQALYVSNTSWNIKFGPSEARPSAETIETDFYAGKFGPTTSDGAIKTRERLRNELSQIENRPLDKDAARTADTMSRILSNQTVPMSDRVAAYEYMEKNGTTIVEQTSGKATTTFPNQPNDTDIRSPTFLRRTMETAAQGFITKAAGESLYSLTNPEFTARTDQLAQAVGVAENVIQRRDRFGDSFESKLNEQQFGRLRYAVNLYKEVLGNPAFADRSKPGVEAQFQQALATQREKMASRFAMNSEDTETAVNAGLDRFSNAPGAGNASKRSREWVAGEAARMQGSFYAGGGVASGLLTTPLTFASDVWGVALGATLGIDPKTVEQFVMWPVSQETKLATLDTPVVARMVRETIAAGGNEADARRTIANNVVPDPFHRERQQNPKVIPLSAQPSVTSVLANDPQAANIFVMRHFDEFAKQGSAAAPGAENSFLGIKWTKTVAQMVRDGDVVAEYLPNHPQGKNNNVVFGMKYRGKDGNFYVAPPMIVPRLDVSVAEQVRQQADAKFDQAEALLREKNLTPHQYRRSMEGLQVARFGYRALAITNHVMNMRSDDSGAARITGQ